MPKSMVGLLAAVGATLLALASLTNGPLRWVMIIVGFAATWLINWLSARLALPRKDRQVLPAQKKVTSVYAR